MKKCIVWMLTLLLAATCVLPLWNSAQAASVKTVYILDSGVRIVLPAGTSVETEQERKATYSAPYGVFDVTVDITKWALKDSDDFAGYHIQYNGTDMYVEESSSNHCTVRFNGSKASYTINLVDLHGNARSLMYDVFGISGPTDDPTDTPTDTPAVTPDPVLEDLEYTVYSDYVEITGYNGTAAELEIPAEIEGKPVTSIGFCAFEKCKSLVSVKIPEGVTTIENDAFASCSNLKSITLPETLTSIDNDAFINCVSLSSITIPDSVTSIDNGAFINCENLTSIKLPAGLTRIGSEVFYNCNKLTSIKLPDSVTIIDWYAFAYCKSLTSIAIPAGVTTIYSNTFYECQNLTSIKLPDGLTSIGSGAFYNCKKLTSIDIPAGVTGIYESALGGCKELNSIYFYGYDDITIADSAIPSSATIYCYRSSAVDSWATEKGYNIVYLDDVFADYDIHDALLVMQYIAGWNVSLDLDHADVDASGSVDIQDALLILRYVSGETVALR